MNISSVSPEQKIIEYCLYARKSSEDDERQAMSINSQIKEMSDMAVKEGLFIKEIREESHSAKMSGQRPIFGRILTDLRSGMFTGILTWAPDRLSRNAGDLGMLVDLMDQGKLIHIKTFTQAFSDTPSEKFLLMILCSQAKLENDQKGINVKRGIRAKCQMGWRPGPPPLGYYNRAFNGIKDIIIDPERSPLITEMFQRVALNGDSGRTLKKWLDTTKLTTRNGKKVTLSMIYNMLRNPFYFGEFQYPMNSETWYKGAHVPLISKETFEMVQEQLTVPRKAKWGAKGFAFKELMKCGNCGASVIGEDKYRKLRNGGINYHIYYHCSRYVDFDCREPYVNEDELQKQFIRLIDELDETQITISEKLRGSLLAYQKIIFGILKQEDIEIQDKTQGLKGYAKYALKEGTTKEKSELIKGLKIPLILMNGSVQSLVLS